MSVAEATPPEERREFMWSEADQTVYQMVLANFVGPIGPAWAFAALNGLVFASLGHPWVALAMTLGVGAADWRLRQQCLRWQETAADEDSDKGVARLSTWNMIRNAGVLAVPTAMALWEPRMANVVYLAVLASGALLIAAMQSLLSAPLFRKAVAPPMAALAAVAFLAQRQAGDVALFGSLLWLGGILALIGIAAEKARADLLAKQAEKNRLIGELTAARDEARSASQAKSTFLATMSHEIRTPMNGVLGMAQLLQRSRLSHAQRGQVDTLIRSGELLMTILNDILDLSTIDVGRMDIQRRPCDLRALMAEMHAGWSAVAAEKRLMLTLDVDETLPAHLALDELRVRQILFNLVGNALKFTEEGGVAVAARATVEDGAPRLAFEVVDTGVGIPQEALPGLFQPFSQVDGSSVRRYGGTGLGLAICDKLCGLMGGTIAVESRLGEGSTFRVVLPLDACEAPAARPAAAPADPQGERGLTVLAADDNPTNLLVLEQLLSALGFTFYKAGGGREALDALSTQSFDLVLMDIQMPEMTGVDVLNTLRARPGPNQATPLIAVTADALGDGRDRYRDLGFADYVAKPVQATRLITAMMAAVANAGDEEVPQAAAG